MALGAIAAFWMVSLMFVVTPGADWAYAITAGLRHRTVTPAVGGMLAGHLVVAGVVAAGVAALVSQSPVAMTALTTVGAVYLVWLGVGMLTKPAGALAADESVDGSWKRRAAKGFGVSGLNPKVLLLFLALLPQFTDPASQWPLSAQIMTLAVVHVASSAVVYMAVALGSSAVLKSRPAAARAVSMLSGAAMIVIGGVLLLGAMLD